MSRENANALLQWSKKSSPTSLPKVVLLNPLGALGVSLTVRRCLIRVS